MQMMTSTGKYQIISWTNSGNTMFAKTSEDQQLANNYKIVKPAK